MESHRHRATSSGTEGIALVRPTVAVVIAAVRGHLDGLGVGTRVVIVAVVTTPIAGAVAVMVGIVVVIATTIGIHPVIGGVVQPSAHRGRTVVTVEQVGHAVPVRVHPGRRSRVGPPVSASATHTIAAIATATTARTAQPTPAARPTTPL